MTPYDNATSLYVHTAATLFGSSLVLKYANVRQMSAPSELFSSLNAFIVVDRYMFATRNVVSRRDFPCSRLELDNLNVKFCCDFVNLFLLRFCFFFRCIFCIFNVIFLLQIQVTFFRGFKKK